MYTSHVDCPSPSLPLGQTSSGTVVPSTSEDKTAVFDPLDSHDYDEVANDEAKSPTSQPNLKPEILRKLPKPPSPYSKRTRPNQPTPYKMSSPSLVPKPSLRGDVYSTVEEAANDDDNAGDYAELNDIPERVAAAEKETEVPVTRSKFNLVMERLRKITVSTVSV